MSRIQEQNLRIRAHVRRQQPDLRGPQSSQHRVVRAYCHQPQPRKHTTHQTARGRIAA